MNIESLDTANVSHAMNAVASLLHCGYSIQGTEKQCVKRLHPCGRPSWYFTFSDFVKDNKLNKLCKFCYGVSSLHIIYCFVLHVIIYCLYYCNN